MSAQVELQDSRQVFRVLVVDDDPTVLSLLKEIIGMIPGCEVITASQAEEAMKQVVSQSIDVVFTDIHMPGVTGVEMLRDIVALEQTPEVVVMTAYPSGDIAQEAMELGAASLLSKPFDDISLVELELDRCIKKILRQRAAAKEVEKKKKVLSEKPQTEVDSDPVMKLSLEPIKELEILDTLPPKAEELPAAAATEAIKALYKFDAMRTVSEIEMRRCDRTKRQFCLGLIELPEKLEASSRAERQAFRDQQIQQLRSLFRSSDAVFDAEKDGIAVLAFECNRAGSSVLEFKLNEAGFGFSGLSVYPVHGQSFEDLISHSRSRLQDKRKHKILLFEKEEFFGQIVKNMLIDPKYQVSWEKEEEACRKFLVEESESIKLMIISLTKDSSQWKLLARLKQENLINFPILLFSEVKLSGALKQQMQQLGVRAVVKKGSGQEDFLYVVQSFVMQPSVTVMRKNPRALITLPVIYKAGSSEVSSNTFTLSRDGLFIRDLNPPPSETVVDVQLFIPKRASPLQAKARVIYSVPYFVGVNRIHVPGMALKFEEPSDELQNELDQVVSEALTSYLIED